MKYDYIDDFSEGLAKVFIGEIDEFGDIKEGKYGYINKEGKEVIPLKYDYIYPFENGKAKVELNGEEFYINTKGERVE